MKLYSFQPSPFGSRVRLALRRKGLAFDIAPPHEVDPAQSPILAPNAMESPTLTDGQVAVAGSAAILDYLEDAHPDPALLPRAPADRARARMLTSSFDGYLQNTPRQLFAMADPAQRDGAAVDRAFGLIATGLGFVDARIDGSGGWSVGGAASIGDCALVPMLNAIAILGKIHGRADVIADHARVAAYWIAAQQELLHAEVIAEQLAGLPAPLHNFIAGAA